MKKTWLWLFLLSAFLLAGCAAGPNPFVDHARGGIAAAGFWLGIWHGMIAPVTFWISLFFPTVGVYEVFNTGHWYDFGFGFGVLLSVSGTGGGAAARARRRRK